MKRILVLVTTAVVSGMIQTALAHEFWLMPQRFLVKAGELVKVSIGWGKISPTKGLT